jgi:nucleoside-diphosphate-sugar epimerase
MDRCLVTGAAGFIGSHLARRLLGLGHEVVGIDSFTDYYDRSQKEDNIADLLGEENFTFIEGDLLEYPLAELLPGTDLVFHQAAQAGVRASWGKNFRVYLDNNVLATQLLLEACLQSPPRKMVFASSSSVYGDVERLPASEEDAPRPVSPYGVTKLASENLCRLYWKNFGLPVVNLRYFTVYGPGQRPDMAFHRFLRAMLRGEPLNVFGDGRQSRDFTYVADAVEANLLAAEKGTDGLAYNIGGGHRCTLLEVIRIMEEVSGVKADLKFMDPEKGDVKHTQSDTSRAGEHLGFSPRFSLEEGIKREYEWIKGRL